MIHNQNFSAQDFNRYSYVRNNLLKYTDPSGYFGAVVCSGFQPVVIFSTP
jgi:hypothetical protein